MRFHGLIRTFGSFPLPTERRSWQADGRLYCRVTDSGPGLPRPYKHGLPPVPPGSSSGRGLWLARQWVDRLTIESDANGTSVIMVLSVVGGSRQVPGTGHRHTELEGLPHLTG
ncbi:ATP-binding protein [Nonomuraea sp. NPDC049141]|uniref:ATP-binding protein n=1 Tax=Nonomuraea sp. NPDC049141 TaxID=3155500 RepID=UPI0033E257C1